MKKRWYGENLQVKNKWLRAVNMEWVVELRRTGLWDQNEKKNKTLALIGLKDEIMIKLVIMFYNFLSASLHYYSWHIAEKNFLITQFLPGLVTFWTIGRIYLFIFSYFIFTSYFNYTNAFQMHAFKNNFMLSLILYNSE